MAKLTMSGILLDHFKAHRGEEVWLPDLRQALNDAGLYKNDENLRGIINYLRKTNPNIDVTKPGQCWTYMTPSSNGAVATIHSIARVAKEALNAALHGRTFYQVLERPGYLLIEDEDGTLYVAREIPL